MKHVPLILLILLLAGCTHRNPPTDMQEGPCDAGYYVGCDDNPDAAYMIAKHGLHQFTNTSSNIGRIEVASGMVAWWDGGFGKPVGFCALRLDVQATYSIPNVRGTHAPYTSGGTILHSEVPVTENQADYDAERMWLWTPAGGNQEILADFSEVSARPWKFAYPWALLLDLPPAAGYQDGLLALNVETGELQMLHPLLAHDDSHYGGPHVADAVGGGYAFMSMRYEGWFDQVTTSIIDVDLETRERVEIANLTHSVLHMDASDEYLVLNANRNNASGLWLWNITAREWNLIGSGGLYPMVGGDWVVFLEQGTASNGRDALVGVHIPTLTRYVLIEEGDIDMVKWDTDGEYVVVHAPASREFPRNLEYQGAQLYWMHLPETS